MQTSTQTQITRFLYNASRFSAVVDAVSDWSAPSPCQGWSAADVVAHVVDTQRDFLSQHGFHLGSRREGDPAAWDLGRAAGPPVTFSESEMDAVDAALPTFGDALYAEGTCARPVPVPDDAPRQDRLLARLGRQP